MSYARSALVDALRTARSMAWVLLRRALSPRRREWPAPGAPLGRALRAEFGAMFEEYPPPTLNAMFDLFARIRDEVGPNPVERTSEEFPRPEPEPDDEGRPVTYRGEAVGHIAPFRLESLGIDFDAEVDLEARPTCGLASEPGWERASWGIRRGLWFRTENPLPDHVRDDFDPGAIELCAGREGDDDDVRLAGLSLADRRALLYVLLTAKYGYETEAESAQRSALRERSDVGREPGGAGVPRAGSPAFHLVGVPVFSVTGGGCVRPSLDVADAGADVDFYVRDLPALDGGVRDYRVPLRNGVVAVLQLYPPVQDEESFRPGGAGVESGEGG